MRRLHQLTPHELRSLTSHHAKVSRNYEIWYDLNDFAAGVLFVIGSVLFFWESTMYIATWLFLVGSVLFCVRPGIHVVRDVHLGRLPVEPAVPDPSTAESNGPPVARGATPND